jgi:cytochrome c oxidase subunit 1
MPFRRPRVWAGGKPAISMRACAGVVHAFGSRRLGYPVTTFARPVQAGPEAGPGGSRKGPPLASWLSATDDKISSTGSWILGASTFFFLYNIYKTWKYGERVTKG